MTDELDAFDRAMRVAEIHRRSLRVKFGLSDAQIGQLTLARRRTPRSAMGTPYNGGSGRSKTKASGATMPKRCRTI